MSVTVHRAIDDHVIARSFRALAGAHELTFLFERAKQRRDAEVATRAALAALKDSLPAVSAFDVDAAGSGGQGEAGAAAAQVYPNASALAAAAASATMLRERAIEVRLPSSPVARGGMRCR